MQLYVGFPAAAGEPPKVLKAFRKVRLDPGRRATVTLKLGSRDLSMWDTRATAGSARPGSTAMVGSSSRDIRRTATLRRAARKDFADRGPARPAPDPDPHGRRRSPRPATRRPSRPPAG